MSYFRAAYQRAFHRCQHPGEGRHIGNWYPTPPNFFLLSLWYASAMLPLHTPLQGQHRHCHPTLFATYPQSIPLLERRQLPCGLSLVRLIAPLPPDVAGSSYQCLHLLHIGLKNHPPEHCHCHRQSVLHLYVIPSLYPPVIGV